MLTASENPNDTNGLTVTVCLVDNVAHILQHHEQQQLRLVDHLILPGVLSKFWNKFNAKIYQFFILLESTTEHNIYNKDIFSKINILFKICMNLWNLLNLVSEASLKIAAQGFSAYLFLSHVNLSNT